MASKSQQVNELIICPICFEVYREPKSLPNCLHTFCKSCIKTYSVTAVNKNSNFNNTFECPVCRACYHDVIDCNKWVENLPNNYLIVSLIDQGKMEKKELYCDSCIRLETSQPAVSWCPECCDKLCENCVKFHHTNRFTMEHQVCNLEEREQTDKLEVDLFCKQHASKRLEVYCFDHEEPCCLMCATVSHRKCDKVSSLEDCSQSLGADVTRMLGKLEELQKTCVSEIERVTDDKKSLKDESTEIEKKVKTIREEIIQVLMEKERSFLESLKKTEENESFRLQGMLDELLTVQKTMEDNIKILKNSDEFPKVALFLELKQMEKRVSEIYTQTNKLMKSYHTSVLDGRIDDTVKTFHSCFKTFGEIRLREKKPLIDYLSTKLVLERSLVVEGSSCLTDVDVLDDDIIVTTCQNSRMVYLLDMTGKLLSSFTLKGNPWGIAAIQNKTFCVALRCPGIAVIFKVKDVSITFWKELNTSSNSWGICTEKQRIILSTEKQGGAGQVFRFYDLEGNSCGEREVNVGNSGCGAINATPGQPLLFTHHDGNSLFSLDLNVAGSATKLHEGKNMKYPIGVTRDPNGNIYVVCYFSHKVLQFNKNGNFIREIIRKDLAVQLPIGIRVKRLGDDIKLMLTTKGKVLVYRFGD
ncbi:E3 ubiquitin-protein ligase Midline-1-like [Crassostrea virginica]